jgi:hypothetical protein
LPNIYRRFLQLKVQALEVSDDQVIAQSIKSLRAGSLQCHLVIEQPKIAPELYEQFSKFSKSSNRGRLQKQTKLQDPVIVITDATSRSLCTTLTLMVVDH